MNLLAALTIFFLVEESASSKHFRLACRDDKNEPFALIQKHDPSGSTKLELVIPQQTNDSFENYADYVYDATIDDKDKFLTACPAQSNIHYERTLEEDLKEKGKLQEESTLFILQECKEDKDNYRSCYPAKPSIEKATPKETENGDVEYCGKSKAEIYKVGFPVSFVKEKGSNDDKTGSNGDKAGSNDDKTESNDDPSDFQFVPIYKICYSTTEDIGTLYTVHRIESPSLLLKKVWEYYQPNTEELHKSSLGRCDSCEQSVYKEQKQYAFQFVGSEDMPNKVWRSTTHYSFNYTPITRNEDVIKGMITVDNYIRLYSHATDQPLTLYSGIHRHIVDKPSRLAALGRQPTPTPVDLFWRIIINDQGQAILIVTQHTLMKCDDNSYVCQSNVDLLKNYKKGGCTYTCSVFGNNVIETLGLPSDKVIKRLELSSLNIRGYLSLTFLRRNDLDSKFSKNVSISDFFKESFETALKEADPTLASKVEVYSHNPESDYGYSKSSGSGKSGWGLMTMFGLGSMADSGANVGGGGDAGGGGGSSGFD